MISRRAPAEVEAAPVMVPERRTPLQIVGDEITRKAAQKAGLEAENVQLVEDERLAVEAAAENPASGSAFLKGRGGYEARERRRKNVQLLEDIDVEIGALLRRKERLSADASLE